MTRCVKLRVRWGIKHSGRWKPCWQKPCWQICAHGLRGYLGASVRVRVAPLRTKRVFDVLSSTSLVVQPVHLHQHTRAAHAHKSANMVSILPR